MQTAMHIYRLTTDKIQRMAFITDSKTCVTQTLLTTPIKK